MSVYNVFNFVSIERVAENQGVRNKLKKPKLSNLIIPGRGPSDIEAPVLKFGGTSTSSENDGRFSNFFPRPPSVVNFQASPEHFWNEPQSQSDGEFSRFFANESGTTSAEVESTVLEICPADNETLTNVRPPNVPSSNHQERIPVDEISQADARLSSDFEQREGVVPYEIVEFWAVPTSQARGKLKILFTCSLLWM